MAILSLAFLGPFTVSYDGHIVTEFRTRSVQALLVYLAVEEMASRLHQREALAELLWPGYPPGSARKNLRQALYELRRLIPEVTGENGAPAPLTLGTRDTLQINPDACFELDTARFTRLIHESSVEALRKAVELYRGEFLENFALPDSGDFETWAATWRGHFQREVLEALNHLTSAALDQNDFVQAEAYARRQLELDDLRETSVGQLMQALTGQGQRSAALIAFDKARSRLHDELGIEPGLELNELREQIQIGEISPSVKGHPLAIVNSSKPIKIKPTYLLPHPASPFIGRRTEVEEVKDLLNKADLRLLTLVGPGGIGKTRLSIQVATEVIDVFPDGVFFASLAPVHIAEGMIPALAKALDFSFYREEKRPRQQLMDFLRTKHLLLILDNFEHLIGNRGRELIAEVLSVAPSVKLLITSRVQLNMQGEQLYPVTGMRSVEVSEASNWDNPEEQAKPYSAVQLLLDRARRVQPDFTLTKENVTSVIEICRLVHGMPLALELAAAWVELLTPNEIALEIARSLDFLETNQIGVPDRQHSIRAVFDSSWKLLSKEEQDAFMSLCVFEGSFSREAAQQVSKASLRTLLGLSNKSWLQQTNNGRFQLHELMCQYGEERLKADADDWQEAHNRHAEYFAHFVAEQSLRMQGPEQLDAMSAFENEFNTNIKATWDWMVSERRWNDLIENLLLGLFQFDRLSQKSIELLRWLRDTRPLLAPESTQKSRLAFAIISTLEVYCEQNAIIKGTDPIERLDSTWQMVHQYDLAEAMGFWFVILASQARARNLDPKMDEQLESSIARMREQKLNWQLGMSLLFQANRLSEYVHDVTSLQEAAKIFEDLGVIYEQGVAAEQLGKYAYQQRRPLGDVIHYFRRARQFYQKLNGYSPLSYLLGLADVYFKQGKIEQGFALFEEEKRKLERLGQMRILEANEHWESLFAVRYGTYKRALRLRQHSLELTRKMDSQSDLAWRLFELGEVYRIFGESEKALELYDQAHPLIKKMNMTLASGFEQRARGDLALQEKRYSDALAHYQKFDTYVREDNHFWGMAQSLARIALVLAYLGKIKQARLEMQTALAQTYELREDDLALQTMLIEPVCLLHEGNLEAAIELASFIQHHPASWNETKQHALVIQEAAARDLDQGAAKAAIERGKELDLDSVVVELTAPE